MMVKTSVLHLVLLSFPYVICWELSLLHVNDIHARMEETNKYSSKCRDKDRAKGKCYGGLARMFTAVKDIKNKEENVLWLNAGDFYQGTVWYTQFKWNLISQFNNMMKFDAITLGNHEFDDRLEGIVPFLKAQHCPVVVTNLNTSLVPQLEGLYRSSVVLEVGSKRVGIVGYLTPDTMFTASPPAELVIRDEIEAVTKEVEKLHLEGVDIIIALGHSGYVKDIEIAEKVPHVDIVVGAHSHSFLFTNSVEETNPSNNAIIGPYPTVVKNVLGSNALVVQAFAFTKYLGHIRVVFDDAGVVQNWLGMPILLDKKIAEDEMIIEALQPWKDQLNAVIKETIGITSVDILKGRDRENNIGSFATEAMVWSYRNKLTKDGSGYKLAFLNSGGLRANIPTGNITIEHLLEILPFECTFDSLRISGKYLKEVFEHSVAEFDEDGRNNAGQFLQVSGFKLIFNLDKSVGHRLVSAKVAFGDGFKDLEDEDDYDILTSSYIAAGGDGFTSIPENKNNHQIGPLDTDVIKDYLEAHSPIHPELMGNIRFTNEASDEGEDEDLNCWALPVPGMEISLRFCRWSVAVIYH